MLSKKMHDALNAQINAEMWSAYLYLSMSMDAADKGLKGVANWFAVQYREEQDHAQILINYLLSRGGLLKYVQNTRTEASEVLQAVGSAFQNLDLVVAAFGETVAVFVPKGLNNGSEPMSVGQSTLDKGVNVAVMSVLNPASERFFELIRRYFV